MKHSGTITQTALAGQARPGAALFEETAFHAPVAQADPAQTDPLTRTIHLAASALLAGQAEQGFWHFDLEADATIPAEYILLQHFMGTVDKAREKRLAEYICSRQSGDGSWPLYEAGPGNISATVKSYYALKIAGLESASPIMQGARKWVLAHGGAESANVFTRIQLALFGQIPWRTVPAMPAEILCLPRWFFFSLDKVSYWSRCVIVPLLILFAKRPVYQPGHDVKELFLSPPQQLGHIDRFARGKWMKNAFILIDRIVKIVEPRIPRKLRERSLHRAEAWMRKHMAGAGGIGAIYPAMANAVMALKVLGYDSKDPDMARGVQAIEDLVLDEGDESYVQPCLSPVWDSCLSLSALSECGIDAEHEAVKKSIHWLFEKQVFVTGDWAANAPALEGGGWAFQFENDFYPDVDDTSMVVMALLRAGAHKDPQHREALGRAVNWVLGMQNSDGGWGAFDIDNDYAYLNNIPFADHGALLDPSTEDLAGRCIEMLAMLGYERSFAPLARALNYLKSRQTESGAWYGRWGVNYIYGTWAVLVGLGALGEDPRQPYIRKAIAWLKRIQNQDGGWGEGCDSYDDPALCGHGDSTASQTAWALLGLMAVGEVHSEAVERGIHYLVRNFEATSGWKEAAYTGTGFPRVFYLRYHGYSHYFPLWALGVYRRTKQGLPSRLEQVRDGGPIDLGAMSALSGQH